MAKSILKLKSLKFKLLALAIIFLLPNLALAQELTSENFGGGVSGIIASWFANLFLIIINFLGSYVLLPLINLVVKIVSYNNFLDSHAVTIGWPLVRDVSNMFFVVFLLIIVFSTILKISKYHYKTALFKLILMAILINFSKTIMGFLIDFGQVIMLTFVNAFRDAAANNLVNAFGLTEILKIDKPDPNDPTDTINNLEIFGSLLLGIIMMVVAIGVMLAYVGVLLYRIIALWILVILSPLAFLLQAFDGTTKYASELWTKFWKQLSTGVILAFFLWLALSILAGSVETGDTASITAGAAVPQWERFYSFIVAIALLLTALQYAQEAGGFAGKFAGNVSGKLSQMGSKVARVATSPLRGAGVLAKEGLGYVRDKVSQGIGIPLSAKEWKEGWVAGKESRRKKRRDLMLAKATKRGGIIGALGTPSHFFSDRWTWKGMFQKPFQEGLAGGRVKKRAGRYNEVNEKITRLGQLKERLNEAGSKMNPRARAKNILSPAEFERYKELDGRGEKLKGIGLSEYKALKVKINQGDFAITDDVLELAGLSDEDKQLIKNGINIKDDKLKDKETIKLKNFKDLDVSEDKLKKERGVLDKDMRNIRGPVNYDMKKQLRVDGYLAELKNVTSSEWKELVVDLEDAFGQNRFDRAGAVLLKATSDGNANEVLNQFGYIDPKTGKKNAYGSSGEHLKQFIMRELVGTSGMSKQETENYNQKYADKYGELGKGLGMSMTQGLLLGTDIGYAAEHVNHWQDARLTAAGPGGDMVFSAPDDRQLELAYEEGKITFDKHYQGSNRLVGYDEIPVGTLEEYKITGDRDSFVQSAWLQTNLNKTDPLIYMLARGRGNDSHMENTAKDQNYIIWRKVAEEKLHGREKDSFVALLNVMREIGLSNLSTKGYVNHSDQKEAWREEHLDGPDGHLATVYRQMGIKFNPEVDTYKNLSEKYKQDMNTFSGEGKIDVRIKSSALFIGGLEMDKDISINELIGLTEGEIQDLIDKKIKEKKEKPDKK